MLGCLHRQPYSLPLPRAGSGWVLFCMVAVESDRLWHWQGWGESFQYGQIKKAPSRHPLPLSTITIVYCNYSKRHLSGVTLSLKKIRLTFSLWYFHFILLFIYKKSSYLASELPIMCHQRVPTIYCSPTRGVALRPRLCKTNQCKYISLSPLQRSTPQSFSHQYPTWT